MQRWDEVNLALLISVHGQLNAGSNVTRTLLNLIFRILKLGRSLVRVLDVGMRVR